MGRKTHFLLATLAVLCGLGICAYVAFVPPAPDSVLRCQDNTIVGLNDLHNKVPVPLNRGPEVEDPFQGDVHPILRSPDELEVTAYWDIDRDQDGETTFPQVPRKLQEVLLGLKLAVPARTYAARDFSRFLPPYSPDTVGQTWAIDSDKVAEFLRQFHQSPSMRLLASGRRAGPDGAFAVLRAVSPSHLDIVFRIHAEFDVIPESYKQLVPVPGAWYSPGSFMGQMVINRTTGTVEYFRLGLPNDELHNVHVTLTNGRVEGEVHGWMRVERMELLGGSKERIRDIRWVDQIATVDAHKRLAKIFFKFKEIDWVAFDKAQEVARARNKPIFVVSAMGALDNQTC